jgi:tRNA pseudouridine55 synthase
MLDADKAYEATLRFGEETDSGDLTGLVQFRAPASFDGVSRTDLDAALEDFRGVIEQVPPMHSALKRDGKPLYEYARQGITLERAPRQVQVHRLEVLDFSERQARLLVHCSKGTYVRTLAQDIGRRLGCGAHLVALRRTRVGPFRIEDAIALETLQAMAQPQSTLVPLDSLPDGLLPDTFRQKDTS